MSRKLLLVSFSIFLLPGFYEALAQAKPNILLILSDDVGYKVLTCDGGTGYSTPNLDSMAQQGIRFTQCHASPLCSPSRHALITGKYNFRNYAEWGVLSPDQKTIGNVFKDAGYKTACFGKWQFDGGEQSIHAFGFDSYAVSRPYQDSSGGDRYKSPDVYANGNFVASNLTAGKYSEDIFADSVMNFIDRNQSSPFFIYYPMALAHKPFQPTPDDSTYNLPLGKEDTIYYQSMIKYMDKKIGLIIHEIKTLGIAGKTIVIFLGDNGTPTHSIIDSNFNEETDKGGKGSIDEVGTHVPFIAYCPGKIPAGVVNNNLISFPDFLPSLAEVANVPLPANYGQPDGISFSPSLVGQPDPGRQWIYNYFDPHPGKTDLKRWVQTTMYRLVASDGRLLFYNISSDSTEKHPIPDLLLTTQEVIIRQQLLDILNGYAMQSPPVLDQSTVSAITDSSALLGATITPDGGFASVLERGSFISTNQLQTSKKTAENNPLAEGGHQVSTYVSLRVGLLPQQEYYFRGYAINNFGTGVSPQSGFYTLSKGVASAPSSFIANADSTSIFLKWSQAVFPQAGASKAGYLLIYSVDTPSLIPLPNGLPPTTKIVSGKILITSPAKLPSLPHNSALLQGLKPNTAYHFLLIPYTWDGKHSATYNYETKGALALTAITDEASCIVPAVSAVVSNIHCHGATDGAIIVNAGGGSAPYTFTWSGPGSFQSSSNSVSNLPQGIYHVVVTATGRCDVTKDFQITEPELLTITATADPIKCNGGSTQIVATPSGGNGHYLFTLSDQTHTTGPQPGNTFTASAGTYTVMVGDSLKCSASAALTITEPTPLKITMTDDTTTCNGGAVKIMALATGGNGSYFYTLSNQTDTAGPQKDNIFFTTTAGSYKLSISDSKNCNATYTITLPSCTRQNNHLEVKVFPNPSLTDFTLSVHTASAEKIQFAVRDSYGQRIFTASTFANQPIHFGKNLPSGVYFITAVQGAQKQVLKVLKENK